ncbi:hypothetical protein ACQCT6_12240 [Cytobacillus gottheilii]|uniref:Uncharacterized protein n=1 Tax=Cytobacillus gottheilii TaxID=859144 RepID=A0ABX8FCA9_9BACI|nr:hypothetical protein [Cytobacillus gottheilii]QVY62013.1 hypothetical protein J1899_02525 [Cytobacillus gottheilii]
MLRDVADLYNRNIINILLICLILVVPITFFNYAAIVYIMNLNTLEYANIPALALWVLNFTILFPPFFLIAKMDRTEQEVNLKQILSFFIMKFGFVAAITIVFFAIGMFGSLLLFIPSLIAVLIILLFPLYADRESIKDAMQGVWEIIKREHIFLFIDVLIIVSLNVLVWSGSLYLLGGFENNTLVFIVLRALINSLIFPVVYFYLTFKYRKDFA